jgi:hypothetical protein
MCYNLLESKGDAIMAEKGTVVTIEEQVSYHLENMTVPVPQYMVKPCVEAIEAVKAKDYDRVIALPEKAHTVDLEGNTYSTAMAWEIVLRLHLENWIK